jgi:hypothetical protein
MGIPTTDILALFYHKVAGCTPMVLLTGVDCICRATGVPTLAAIHVLEASRLGLVSDCHHEVVSTGVGIKDSALDRLEVYRLVDGARGRVIVLVVFMEQGSYLVALHPCVLDQTEGSTDAHLFHQEVQLFVSSLPYHLLK